MIEYAEQIGTIGFPIVAFLLMYKFSTDTVQRNTDAITGLKDAIICMFEQRK